MKLVVGLGNPGKKYAGTRHNVGFDVLACLAQRYDIGRPKSKFNAEVAETIIKSEKTILLSPLTYMNLSGQSVRAAVDFYKLPVSDVLVICDDMNLDVARLRLKHRGSAGGQNGLKNIIQLLGTQDVCRLRVGVGRLPPNWDAANFVLGKFSDEDKPEIEKGVQRAADAVEVWVERGIQDAMNQFNADPRAKEKQKSNQKPKTKPATGSGSDSKDENEVTQENDS